MRRILSLAIVLALGTAVPAQSRTPKLFSYDQPDPHSIPLPAAILTILEHDKYVAETLSDNEPAITHLSRDWVQCYRVSLGPAHETDYFVRANPPLGGANVTRFWVFRMIAGQPKLVLFTGGLSLEIESRRSNGLHEIQTFSVAAQRLSTEVYRFNGTEYALTTTHQ